MAQKLVLVADPGIDGAFAATLALLDPELEVLALAACAGNVSAEQATRNMQTIVEQVDPPRLPRIGAAPPVKYDVDGTRLHGPQGLGNASFPCAELHHAHSSDKLIADLVRQHPKEVTVLVMGPLSVLGAALDREPELPALVKRLVCVGGTRHEPGNAGAVTEFHFHCDADAARQVVRCGAPITLVPLDVSRKLVLAPGDLLALPSPESGACRFLRQIVPYGIGATSNLYGIEGFHLKDVLGVAAVALPQVLTTRPMALDVETRGELTRGMCVFDERRDRKPPPNVAVAVDAEIAPIRDYIRRTLAQG